jgi:catechol 2,3-dioxygenase-like lactoylglutathione lyase family enzyme
MSVELNHTIVSARDPEASARFVTEILGLEEPSRFGPFSVVQTANDVSLDYLEESGAITPQHYAFLVSESEFDSIKARIDERGLGFWADPGRSRPDQINHRDDGRGLYFEDPDGHMLEILTRPYGSGA